MTQAVSHCGRFSQKRREALAQSGFPPCFGRLGGHTQHGTKEMLKNGNLREDAQLRPGDMWYVPKNPFEAETFLPVTTLGWNVFHSRATLGR